MSGHGAKGGRTKKERARNRVREILTLLFNLSSVYVVPPPTVYCKIH
jgi:hypothetical protein